MSLDDILARLELPQPLRQGELALMTGVSAPTIREQVKAGKVASVGLPGMRERRIPIAEAKRLLAMLRIIPRVQKGSTLERNERNETADRKALRFVRA